MVNKSFWNAICFSAISNFSKNIVSVDYCESIYCFLTSVTKVPYIMLVVTTRIVCLVQIVSIHVSYCIILKYSEYQCLTRHRSFVKHQFISNAIMMGRRPGEERNIEAKYGTTLTTVHLLLKHCRNDFFTVLLCD